MAEALALKQTSRSTARDLVELGKPRITTLVVFTTAIGLWLAPGTIGVVPSALFLAATALLVSSANTLNCWIERDSDGRMVRTRDRALPSGRLSSSAALASGVVQGVGALAVVLATTNALTFVLGAIALVTYVLVYTPMKRWSALALHVGAVPGAIPPLMGWTAVTGHTAPAGWALFAILFAWQLPHFGAIALYLENDYRRGGLRVLSVAVGESAARWHLLAYTGGLVAASVAPWAIGTAGPAYLLAALALGAVFVHLAVDGVRRRAGAAWARRLFVYSVVYLPLLAAALLADSR